MRWCIPCYFASALCARLDSQRVAEVLDSGLDLSGDFANESADWLSCPHRASVFYSAYFFGEYSFGLLLVAGCRHYAIDARLKWKHAYLPAVSLLVALVLPFV